APAGGLWKSTTGGNNWTVCGTDDLPTIGIASIAIDPSNPDIIYIGTGDRDGWSTPGMGVYKSTDGGISWSHMNNGLGWLIVTRLLISSDYPSMLIAATNDGVYKTLSSGASWTHSSGISGFVSDMCFKPGTFEVVYACVDGHFFRSDTHGSNWEEIFFSGESHRSVIGVSPANPAKVHFFCTKDGEAYKHFISNDSGQTFPTSITPDFTSGQGGYNLDIAVDPTNENIIYLGMVGFRKSTNGGSSWSDIGKSPLHADQHAMEWSPLNGRLYIANDGGIYYTADGGSSYTDINQRLSLGMTDRLHTSFQNSNILICGQQDCGTFVTTGGDFYHTTGGDGMDCQIDPTNSNIIYSSWQHGPIKRTTDGTAQGASYHNIAGYGGINGITDTCGAWVMPFQLHEDNPSIMYAGFQNLWKSTNVNTSDPSNVTWTKLTNFNDDKTMGAFSKSPVDDNIIWVVRGLPVSLHLTTNANSPSPAWINIYLPFYGHISWIETHPEDANTCYVCVEQRIYKTTNLGSYWERIDGNLPGISKKCIVCQAGSNENLYVATQEGVYFKDAAMGDTWVKYKTGMPSCVPVSFLDINYGTVPPTLFAGTWGRGIWKTEIYPLQKPNLLFTNGAASVNNNNVTINVGLKNDGANASSDPCVLGYYLSDNNIISPSDALIGTDNIGELYPGIITGQSIQLDVEYGLNPPLPGTYYLGAYADKDFIVDEISETDNLFLFPQTVTINTPGIAQNVTASDGEYGNQIIIDWDPPSGATDTVYYRVFRNTSNNSGTAQPIGIVWNTTTAQTDFTAEDGIDYWYWVRASHNFLGVNPGPWSAYDIGWQYLDPPTNVQATDGEYNDRVKITWDPPQNGTFFKVWRNTTSNPNTATPLSSVWYTWTDLNDLAVTSGTYYYYWVKSSRSNSGHKESPNFSAYDAGWAAFLNPPVATASDGTSTSQISITWNTVPGATHYKLNQSYTNDPLTATPLTAWITGTSFNHGAQRGVYSYYWVQAATSVVGTMATGLGTGDAGWRKLEPVQNVNARDGESTDYVQITWNNQTYASLYRVYRNLNPVFSSATPVSDWISAITFNDSLAYAPPDYFYWVVCANNPEIPGDPGAYNIGWRKLYTTSVTASQGMYGDKIRVTWTPVPGAGSYRLFRGQDPWITDTLTEWSSTLNFQYDDYAVTQDIHYYYWVQAAYNNYGNRPGDMSSQAWGFAGECGNYSDDQNSHYKSFHGVTIGLSHRVLNTGPYSLQNPSRILYFLTDNPQTGWDYVLGQKQIPGIPAGGYLNVSFQSMLDTISDGPVPYGTYYVGYYLNIAMDNCETNQVDNYIVWSTQPINYTDALFGTYTIGGANPDYPNFSMANIDLINKGISDNVTFNIRPGFYNEQMYLPAINGCSNSKSIVFQAEPGKGDTAEISFASFEDNFTVMFDGASYITLKNLKLTSTGYSNYQGTYGKVIEIKNNASNITIENCRIKGSSDLNHITEDIAAIYCGNSVCDNIIIKNNLILNGSWGIYMGGTGPGAGSTIQGTLIEMNEIRDFSYKGIFLRFHKNPVIRQNLISYSTTPVSQSFGIELEGTEDGLTVEKNQIIMEPSSNVAYGIYLYYSNNNSTVRGKVANNFISMISSGKPMYGLVHFVTQKTDVFYNSVNISGTSFPQSHAVLLDCDDETGITYDNKVLNNIFANQAGGYSIGIGNNAIINNYLSSCDYNDLFTNGSFIGHYGDNNDITNLAAWKAATPFDDHSVAANPEFTTYTDLHTSSSNINGLAIPLAGVPYDIDWDSRDWQFPDIGADEYFTPPPDLDVAVTQIITPVSGFGMGNQEPVEIEITNYGNIGLGSLVVNYTVNGGTPVTELFSDTLGPFGEIVFYTFNTGADLSAAGTYEIKAYPSLPGDERPSNDTMTVSVTNEPINPYNCIPLYGAGCAYGADIESFYFNNLAHEYTGCSQNAYGDFTNMSATINQGEYYWVGFSSQSDNMYLALWIDYNDDIIFSENEKVKDSLYCEYAGTQSWDTLNIPAGAAPGQHLVRARAVYNESAILPCNYYEYGEAHDYTVTVKPGGGLAVYAGEDVPVCSGNPAVLSASASGGTPPYTYLWSNGMNGPSITVSVDTTTIFTVQAKDQSGYIALDNVAVFITDPPESLPSTNSPVCEGSDILLEGDGAAFGMITSECQTNCSLPSNYCDSYAIDIMGTSINAVYFNTIQNNPADSCQTYSNFTSIQTTVLKGSGYNLSVRSGGCYGDQYHIVSAFIDWNRDADFDDAGEMVAYFDPIFSTTTQDTIVQVPMNAVLGKTMMRVVTVGDWSMAVDTVLPCGTYFNGETEDYTVNIVGTEPNQITSWYWSGPAGFSSFLQNPVITSAVPAMEGYYSLEVEDSVGCLGADSVYVGIQQQPYSFAGQDTTICEGSPLHLNGYAEDWSSVEWTTSGTGYFNVFDALSTCYFASPGDIQNGSVILTLTVFANAPCVNSASSSLTVTIQGIPSAVLIASDTTCSISGYQVAGAQAQNYSSLLWTTSGTGFFSNPQVLNPVYYPGQADEDAGSVDLTLSAFAINPCSNEYQAGMELVIQKEPMVFAGNDTAVCSNESMMLSSAFSSGCSSLLWATGGTGSFSNPSAQNPQYFFSQQDIQTGSVLLTLTGTAVSPCTGNSSSFFTLTITKAPYVYAGGPGLTCGNTYYELLDSDASDYDSLHWETSGSGYFSDPDILHPLYYPGSGETGQVILGLWAYGNSPCAEVYSNLLLNIQPAPAAFAGNDGTIQQGSSYYISDATASYYFSLEWTTSGLGYFDDPYILNPVYHPDPGETGTTVLTLTAVGFPPCGNASDQMDLEITTAGFSLDLKVFLEGPFIGPGMSAILNTSGFLPLTQPYNTYPWNYTGTEAVAAIPNGNVVDWALIELRDAANALSATSSAIVARQAAFLLKDGLVVSTDGQSVLQFSNVTVQQSLYLVIWHRNSIGIMSAVPLTETGGVYSYDFTTGAGQAFGGLNAHKELSPGLWGMAGADGNSDGQINNGDKIDVWSPQAGTGGYKQGDFNLDAQVNNSDKIDIWIPNTGMGGQVPDMLKGCYVPE
ncbi:MAG: right-handed parallel beta-helix repeat-containing protein, partial [Bacteroidales bacterium]|nr:right-handed parallel beta-helix repeat-containing protein [Bacteroidales bacterium]